MKYLTFIIVSGLIVLSVFVVKNHLLSMTMTLLILSLTGVLLQIPNILKPRFSRQLNIAIFLSLSVLSAIRLFNW